MSIIKDKANNTNEHTFGDAFNTYKQYLYNSYKILIDLITS